MLARDDAAALARIVSVIAACAAIALLGLTSCTHVAGSATVVRVGKQAITKTTVEHWANAVKRGDAFSGFRGSPPAGPPRRRALVFLISSAWLIAEAARQGVAAPARTVEQALAEREHESPTFQQRLHATGQTIADVELQLRAELAAAAIQKKLADRAAQIRSPEVGMFYRANRSLFRTPEKRVVDVLGAPSSAAADRLVRRIGTGLRFAKLAFRKTVLPSPYVQRTPEEASVAQAMFRARLGVASRPMTIDHSWIVFVVRKALPGGVKPLASARGEVLALLIRHRQQSLTNGFAREYGAGWVSATSCEASYVVPGCAQSQAPPEAYENPFR